MGVGDEDLRLQLAPGLMYYLGRLEGRTPDVDWINRVVTYAEAADEAQLMSVQQRCSGELIAKGEEMLAKGQGTQDGGG